MEVLIVNTFIFVSAVQKRDQHLQEVWLSLIFTGYLGQLGFFPYCYPHLNTQG